MVSYIYTYLAVNDIVRLPHPGGGDSQGQETFLAPSADKKTHKYTYTCMYVCINVHIYIYIYYYSFHQKIKSIKYKARFAITSAIRGALEKTPTQKQALNL